MIGHKEGYGSDDALLSAIRIIDANKTTLDALCVVHSLCQFRCLLIYKLAESNSGAQTRCRVSFQSTGNGMEYKYYSSFTIVPTD